MYLMLWIDINIVTVFPRGILWQLPVAVGFWRLDLNPLNPMAGQGHFVRHEWPSHYQAVDKPQLRC